VERLSKAFQALGARAVAPLLDVLLRDPDDRMRIFAASLLGEIQDSIPAGLLRDALRTYALPLLEGVVSSTEDAAVRHHSIVALGKIGDPASFDFLVDTLRRSEGWPFEGDAIERSLPSAERT
jgi:HEAT repeat protein